MKLPRPTHVTPIDGYKLEITFANGELKIMDMNPYLAYPAFQALTEKHLFMKARIAHHTVIWSDEIDIAPESLYLESLAN